MMVYDVVQTVDVNAQTSLPKGTVLAGFSDTEGGAESMAELWNQHACPGVRYTVECHEETSTARRVWHADVREDGTIRRPECYQGRRCI